MPNKINCFNVFINIINNKKATIDQKLHQYHTYARNNTARALLTKQRRPNSVYCLKLNISL